MRAAGRKGTEGRLTRARWPNNGEVPRLFFLIQALKGCIYRVGEHASAKTNNLSRFDEKQEDDNRERRSTIQPPQRLRHLFLRVLIALGPSRQSSLSWLCFLESNIWTLPLFDGSDSVRQTLEVLIGHSDRGDWLKREQDNCRLALSWRSIACLT